ncbi:hypothetical protein PYCCODRAFT_960279 [Trametes coccinea BRFM310]|uniref:Uncharacterized protein n=1 Tax=Trametes coccinea (strain BRFM310) TaxID=1353009 RepID=A0A1Y2IZT6_TRAC3|nr:hypothetical protein PYCCODRAFT_960279 [Trametes coccinea BRFM310]
MPGLGTESDTLDFAKASEPLASPGRCVWITVVSDSFEEALQSQWPSEILRTFVITIFSIPGYLCSSFHIINIKASGAMHPRGPPCVVLVLWRKIRTRLNQQKLVRRSLLLSINRHDQTPDCRSVPVRRHIQLAPSSLPHGAMEDRNKTIIGCI